MPPTKRQQVVGTFRAAWKERYGLDPTIGGAEVKLLADALDAWESTGGTVETFCAEAIPAYLADSEKFLGDKRHHPRHLRAKLDAYRVPAGGAAPAAACPFCSKALGDGRPTTMTNEGEAHSGCADQARRPA